jgi:inhibitor of KinA
MIAKKGDMTRDAGVTMDLVKWTALGDQAVLAYFSEELAALAYAASVRQAGFSWLMDVVQAYASVAVFFDLDQIHYAAALAKLQRLQEDKPPTPRTFHGQLHCIPCCYEFQLDLNRVSEQTGLPPETIIQLHSETEYIIYAIGFCPGFPYLGFLPESIANVPRLETPRKRVEVGSVGLTGRQTGIYTEARPGGWNLIGRTPLELVNVEDGYFPLRTGDRVRFERIDEAEFRRVEGERL